MSRLFHPSDPLVLPRSIKMNSNSNHKPANPDEISAFVDNKFIVTTSSMPTDDLIRKAHNLAETFNCTPDQYTAFVQRFVNLIHSRMQDLCQSICTGLNIKSNELYPSLQDHISKTTELFEKAALQTIERPYSTSPDHYIHPDHHDFLFHMTAILNYLSHPFHHDKQRGLVVLCSSQSIMEPLVLLTKIISESKPPENLYALIPTPKTWPILSPNLSTNLLLVITDPCDLEAATRNIVSTIRSGSRYSNWFPNVILVQESISSRLTNRLSQILNGSKGDQPNLVEDVSSNDQTKLILISSGARLIHVVDESYLISIVIDAVPALVDQWICSKQSLVFIINFRTIKEAFEIANYHLSNQRQKIAKNALFPNSDVVVNLWSHDQNMAWQMFDAMASLDIGAIYINSTNEDFLCQEYGRVFRTARTPKPTTNNSVENLTSSHLGKLADLFISSLKSQESLINRNPKSWHTELLGLKLDCGLSLLRDCFQTYTHYAQNVLGYLTYQLSQTPGSNQLQLGTIRLKPAGPIVLLVDQSLLNVPPNILYVVKLLICALIASNSVVVLTYSSVKAQAITESPFFVLIRNIQTQLSIKNLVQVHSTDLQTVNEVRDLVRNSFESGLGLQIEGSDHGDLKTQHMTSLFRPVCMFWAMGQNVFA